MNIKPAYWIGIMALIGAISGTIIGLLFPELGVRGATSGTIIGITIGTVMYSIQAPKGKSSQ